MHLNRKKKKSQQLLIQAQACKHLTHYKFHDVQLNRETKENFISNLIVSSRLKTSPKWPLNDFLVHNRVSAPYWVDGRGCRSNVGVNMCTKALT